MRSAVLAAGAAGLLLSAAGAVHAQAAKPEPAKAEASKPEAAKVESAEAAAATAAMERAQRMAANPMKVILQASKIRRRPDAETAPEPVRAGVRTVSTNAAVATPAAVVPAAAPRNTLAVAPAPAVVLAPPPVAAPSPAPAEVVVEPPAPAPAPAPAPVPVPALAEPVVVPVATPTAKAAVIAPPAAAPVVAPAITAPAQTAVASPVITQPKLVTMLEPDIPPRLLIEGPRVSEIFADLTLRADGSVASVALLPGVPRTWQRYVVSALERWRFEPLPAGRVHRVQLVFGE